MALRQFQPYLDDVATIRLVMEKRFDTNQMSFTIESEQETFELFIQRRIEEEVLVTYLLTSFHHFNLDTTYTVYDQDRNHSELAYGAIVRGEVFEKAFTYDGNDLGANYQPNQTTFKLWAPISKQVLLLLDGITYPLSKFEKGVWSATISGDWDGHSYYYLHRVNGEWVEVHDPYALSSLPNSGASVVINPEKLATPTRATTQIPLSQAILYEMSVRDFSQQQEAGFKHRGQFSGLTESPQLDGYSLGMDYVKSLGVTHIQLMPLYDFGSVDELHPEIVYNWGYDPVQYNVPEGSFSSNPNDPYARIVELQAAIQAYHDADLGVIMDVVYNHVYHAETYAFERIVPGYFYRYDQQDRRTDGTFCGNDVASERSMVRNYIKHSLKQWVTLYGFDGFRFDLMGILDRQTMQEIASELQELHPNIYLYGEGWRMGTGLPYEELAHQYNASQLPTLAFFNDHYRDTLKKILLYPSDLHEYHIRETIQNVLAASRYSHFISPQQSLNYLECHDNATLFDYVHIQQPHLSRHAQKRAASFGLQLVLISQGLTFIHSGQEFFRTKGELENTYNSPDAINQVDWTRAVHYQEHIQFIQELIAFRKAHPSLSLTSYEEIQKNCDFYWLTDFVLRYQVSSETETIQFIINFSTRDFLYTKEEEQVIQFTYPPVVDNSQKQILIAGQSICTLIHKKTSKK
ncbi:type I pullulanase [Streptococcus ovis]|uniref:type I pullulanase n=1 Tax=Streptococcus ovis TaxID=82806 RepID=UPI00037912A9|nr:type I pullulanase [Streptococcus ovis]